MIRRWIVLTFCALVLAACEVRSYLDIDMSDPSDGSVSVQLGFDQQFRDAMEEVGGGTDLLGELESDAPGEGWEVERFEDGEIEGVALTKEFSSLEELETIVEEGRISGPQESLVGAVTFTDSGDTIRFEADVPESGDFEGFDPEQVQGLLTYDARIRVTFPGEVVEHNGEVEGNTVTWSFDDPAAMSGAELFAEARKASSTAVAPIIGVVLAVGVGALVVWQILSRRQPHSAEGLAAGGSEHHPAGSEPPAQPSNESA